MSERVPNVLPNPSIRVPLLAFRPLAEREQNEYMEIQQMR